MDPLSVGNAVSARLRIPVAGQFLSAIHAEGAKPSETEAPESAKKKRAEKDKEQKVSPMPPLAIMAHNLPFGTMHAHEDLFGRIENLFVEMGISTLRFDFRGCGESDAPPGGGLTLGSASADLGAAMAWGAKHGYSRFLFVAEGLAASLCLPRIDETVSAAVLLWPVLDPKQMAVERFDAHPDMESPGAGATVTLYGKKVSRQLIYEMVRTDLRPFMKKIKIPLLIQQGDQDEEIPQGQLDIARRSFRTPRIDITTYAGAGHGLTDSRHRKYMLYHIQQFIEKFGR